MRKLQLRGMPGGIHGERWQHRPHDTYLSMGTPLPFSPTGQWQPFPCKLGAWVTSWGLYNYRLCGIWLHCLHLVSFPLVIPVVTSVVIVQSLSYVQLFVTPWTAACQASLSFTISQSLLKLMFIKLVMPSNHLILCHPILLLPSIFPSIRVFSRCL